MRRADRLFQLVQLIRGRRLSTAAYLAERLQVSLKALIARGHVTTHRTAMTRRRLA